MSTTAASRQKEAVKTEKNGARDVNQQISRLRDQYEAEDWAAAQSFLLAHPSALTLLKEARPHLAAAFGESAPVCLKMVPEDGPEPFSLFADVCVMDDGLTAFEELKRFDAEWWLDACVRSNGSLNFSVEFADSNPAGAGLP